MGRPARRPYVGARRRRSGYTLGERTTGRTPRRCLVVRLPVLRLVHPPSVGNRPPNLDPIRPSTENDQRTRKNKETH